MSDRFAGGERRATTFVDAGFWPARVLLAALAAMAGCADGNGDTVDDDSHTRADAGPDAAEPDTETALHGRYRDYFAIGAAVDKNSYKTHAAILKGHFNSITAENEMKAESLQLAEGKFTFDRADGIVAFAEENDMRVRGHALVWHRQTPRWMFVDEDGENVSEAVLFERMKRHITEVVTRYKGRIYAWDVVNEVIMNDGAYRTGDEEGSNQSSRWYAIAEERYIAEAFKYAHEADPDAKLFYNDYYNFAPARYTAIYEMLAGLLDAGVPVHGVGLQCHMSIEPSPDPEHPKHHQTVERLEEAIELYASLGLDIEITEMDVSVYISGVTYAKEDFYTEETFTDALEAQQAQVYADYFALFRKHADVITNVTLWGVADDNTWLSELSSGRQDFPLLFDVNQRPKKAFEAIFNF